MTDHSASGRKPGPRPALAFPTDVPPLEPTGEFLRACEEFGIAFDDGDVERLGRYLAMLLAANELVNLTAVTDPAAAWMRHIFDSLTLVPLLVELPDAARIADVGSGGGLPGIPLAICLPGLHFTLMESTGKKAEFIRAVATALKLQNIEVECERAEELARDRRRHRDSYDAVVARAVGPMSVVAELTVPFAKKDGRVLLIKGQKADEELAAAAKALGLLDAEHTGTIDTPTGRVVVLTKQLPTSRTYPRNPGEPKRKPLGG